MKKLLKMASRILSMAMTMILFLNFNVMGTFANDRETLLLSDNYSHMHDDSCAAEYQSGSTHFEYPEDFNLLNSRLRFDISPQNSTSAQNTNIFISLSQNSAYFFNNSF